ncbi:PAAR domain-containing protein [Vibrio mimicus]|uniref:PAAR domain-containing protein n=1 Tax=Vibrio mimicus TaxID=674 RepID=UPI002F92F891
MRPAARAGDMHVCPMITPGVPPLPHVGGPILIQPTTILIGNMPAATTGQTCVCVGTLDNIIQGSMSVLFNNRPAVRMGDLTAHGGIILMGMPNVLIGD